MGLPVQSSNKHHSLLWKGLDLKIKYKKEVNIGVGGRTCSTEKELHATNLFHHYSQSRAPTYLYLVQSW
jgi:hypothetical protein